MSAKIFVILYTRQTKKKHKVWHDGTLKFTSHNKGLLYDEKGNKLDSVFVKDDIQIGDQLESDHYLITIEEVPSSNEEKANNRSADVVPTLPGTGMIPKQPPLHMQGRSNLKPGIVGNPLRQNRVGLKRQRNHGFVPPLLKTSMQVDNQRSYQNPSDCRSIVTGENVSKDVFASLDFENTKDNQTEMYSSKSRSLENRNMDFGRKDPVHSGIFQKIISGMSESPDQIPATNQICVNEGRTANVVDPKIQLNKESFSDFREKSRDLITEARIPTSYDRIYSENKLQNLARDSEIQHHNKSVPHFAKKKATVPSTMDERIQDTDVGFDANFSKVISSCDERENISDLNPLPNSKNKRTASQVLALLKSGTSEITKNTERESNARNLAHSVDASLLEGMSRDPKSFKDHSTDAINFDEKQQEADFIDPESLKPNINTVKLSDIAKISDNEFYSSQNADRDSEFSQTQLKDLGVTNIKSPYDVSEDSSLNSNISPDLNFSMKNDKALWRIGSTSLHESPDRKNVSFSIEGFKGSTNMQESSDPLIRDKNDKSFNENISKKRSLAPTALMSTTYPTLDWSQEDGVSLDNITKTSILDQKVAFSSLESNNKSEKEGFVPKRNTLAEKHDQTLLNIDVRSDYKRISETESKITETFKRDLTLYKAVISSSSNNSTINGKVENDPRDDTNSIAVADIIVNKNNDDNLNKRPFVFPAAEEPQSKRFRIEPEGLNHDAAINRDELCRIECHTDVITENSSPKLFVSAKGSENAEIPIGKLDQTENILLKEALENVLDEEGFRLVQSDDNYYKSGITDSALLSNNKSNLTTKDEGEFTNVNVSSVSQASNDKSISKCPFKSQSANKSKESNCFQAEDNVIQKITSQNDISLQIKSENICTLSNALSKSPLSDSVVHPNGASSAVCWDNSSSDDGLNFDLSFNFEDNSHLANNKQTDADQNTELENLEVGNIKSVSCFLDPQVKSEEKFITKAEKKTETVGIPKSISADDSSIGSNEISDKQDISDSSYVNRSILDNLKPQLQKMNDHSDFNSHPIQTSRDVTEIVSISSSGHLKTKNQISDRKNSLENNNPVNMIFDTPFSNQKETIQESNQKEYLLNNTYIKRDGSILNNNCKDMENNLSRFKIEHFDSSQSNVDSQGLDEMCESHTPNADNGKNMNHEVQHSNFLYSSLDELSFSPDPFDKFESGLDETTYQKEMIPSSGSGICKSLGFTNTSIIDSSVKASEMTSLPWDKINTSGVSDVDEVIFSPIPYGEETQAKLEFNSINPNSDYTQNSGTLSGKSEVSRIGQLFPLTMGQNIQEERSQHSEKHQDFQPQQRLIQQTKLRHPSEICEYPLPHPSRLKGKMDPPKKHLLSRAADLNGYRMHGSVFSDMVKRTKASSDIKGDSLVFMEEKLSPGIFHNSTRSFPPQENASYTAKEFEGDFNSIAPKLIKRTKMDTYSPRVKTQGKDLYIAQNNAAYYDFDQIVPSHNDIICSPNNENDITVPSFPKSIAYGQPSSPCLSPCGLYLKEFENGFPESTSLLQNEFISYQEFSNEFPLSPQENFSNHNSGLKNQRYMKTLEESSFDYEHYPKTLECSRVSFDPYWDDPGKTFAYNEHSNTEQTESPLVSYSPQSLTLNLNPPNGYPSDSFYEINKVTTASNSELNGIMKNIDLFNSTEHENLKKIQHILVSDNTESQLSDCQKISSSESLRYKDGGSHTDMKPFSSKRKTEPVKSKPFEDSVTHENYNSYYYSSKSCTREKEEFGNTENEFSDNQHLILSQESINFEREVLINRNVQLKNEISNQFGSLRDERDWNFREENRIIIHSQQEIGSMQFVDPNQNPLTLFPDSELLQTYSFYKECTSDDIREYDNLEEENDSNLCSNSFSGSFGLLPPLRDPSNESVRLRIQDEDDKQLYNKPDFKILDQIHNGKESTLFEPDILQIRKQVFSPKYPQLGNRNNNSINLVTPDSYFSDSPSASQGMAMHDTLSQFTPVAKLFKSPPLTQQSLEIQSQSSNVATTDCTPSELPKNQSERLSNLLKLHRYDELNFPSQQDVAGNMVPKRRMVIPVTFQNVTEYKKILTSVLKEHLNIILFELSSNYHNSMAKADLSSYQRSEKNPSISSRYPLATGNQNPNCNCGLPSKMIQVRKEGKNKGRFFYSCTAVQNHRCKFFQWADQFDQQTPRTSSSSPTASKSQLLKLCDGKSINFYLRRHHIMFYCESVFVRQSPWEKKSKKYQRQLESENLKDRLYIRLSFKDASGCYSKDDLWIISKNLNFEPSVTFIARSVFYGPNSSLELQIEPLAGYFPSNWNTNTVCHAILAGNMSTELSCMMNLQEHVTISSSPIISSLLHRKSQTTKWTRTMPGFKTPFQQCNKLPKYSSHELASLAEKYATFWKLNSGQAKALNNVASMLDSCQSENSPIILIHGVFGSGKSFLLAIIVLYLLEVIEVHQAMKSTTDRMRDEKILISSTTNVAVDRILLYLLEFGCSEFIRVGSVKKIAKPILPLSVHATTSDNHDLKELQEMLKEENLSKVEKQYVRKSIEMHKLGLNKKKLRAVKVVGVTCASCAFNCLEKMKFPIVLLDECSQMTEPASLLPLARFGCEKLLLVGDPLQLDPTIQGSEAENEDGLEQSMFDRLLKMGHESVLLQRQYRCHPAISYISNTLFYGRQLEDGINDKDRQKLVPELPTLCFYDVSEGKEICESSGSFYNSQEADFVINIILALLAFGIEPLSIGVIALYKSQTHEINRKMLESWQNPDNKFLKGKSIKSIQVSTVDAFQGGERDVIILSSVRTSHVGFINNNKRMNVALTRARNHLFIIGKSSNLCTDETWSQVIQICQNSPNSFQSAKQAKIKLLDLCSRAQISEEEEEKSAGTKTKEGRHSDVAQEK